MKNSVISKKIIAVCITCIALFLISFSISNEVQARGLGYKWGANVSSVKFDCNFNSTWTNAVKAAMTTWNNVSSDKPMSCTSDSASSANDISASNQSPETYTAKMFPSVYNSSTWGYVFKSADIVFNTSKSWTSEGAVSGKYDIQSTATHELGHALGIAHCHDNSSDHASGDSAYTMYNSGSTNSIHKRSLTTYDKNAKLSLY
ncbi:matrixin family metalloprotease [Planomicrobium okeanokoites]|mgnify:CR=1 FL=1|uniref:matrixin family metalloprotease n=1 Tax=Planomicrobium okeanokoites TaxID=244 RepID=UPI0024922AD7|nr:matrixin family metalloprotease [Planomicrobium okeanokoites]